jgi:hypothetical protein
VTPGGAVRYSRTSGQTPVWVTAQALAALARKPFPLAPVPRAKRAAPPAAPPPEAAPAPKRPAKKPAAARVKPAPAPVAGGKAGPPTPPDLAPGVQASARIVGYLAGVLFAPIA